MTVNPKSTCDFQSGYCVDVNKWTLEQRKAFGQRLADARARTSFTQVDVALWFEMKKQTVSAWERGKNMPTIEQVAVLAAQYETTVEELTHGPRKLYTMNASTMAALSKMDRTSAERIENAARVSMGLGLLPMEQAMPAGSPGKQHTAGAV